MQIEPLVKEPKSALERKAPPSLWFVESELSRAHAALEAEDDDAMSAEDAQAFIDSYVSPQALKSRRDELARFLVDAEKMIEAKRAVARAYTEAAKRLEHGVERMKHVAIEIMVARGSERLAGDEHVLALRRNPPSVVIDDLDAVPDDCLRYAESSDGDRLKTAVEMVTSYDMGKIGGVVVPHALIKLLVALVAESLRERRAVDKGKVKAEWKEERTVAGVHEERGHRLEIR